VIIIYSKAGAFTRALFSFMQIKIANFIDYYYLKCYHEIVGNVKPDDVYSGRQESKI